MFNTHSLYEFKTMQPFSSFCVQSPLKKKIMNSALSLDLFMGNRAFWHNSLRSFVIPQLVVLAAVKKIVLISRQKYAFIFQIIVVNQQRSFWGADQPEARQRRRRQRPRWAVSAALGRFCTMIMISFFWQHFPLVSHIWIHRLLRNVFKCSSSSRTDSTKTKVCFVGVSIQHSHLDMVWD